MTARDFDPELDCYMSWEAGIAELRRRWLAGEPISPGPWYKPPRAEMIMHSVPILGGHVEATAGSIPLGSATPQGSRTLDEVTP